MKFNPCLNCPCVIVEDGGACIHFADESCSGLAEGCRGVICNNSPTDCKNAATYNCVVVHNCGYEFSSMTHLPKKCPGCGEKINWRI